MPVETPADKAVIDMSSLDNGIYFISFMNEEVTAASRKFVKSEDWSIPYFHT